MLTGSLFAGLMACAVFYYLFMSTQTTTDVKSKPVSVSDQLKLYSVDNKQKMESFEKFRAKLEKELNLGDEVAIVPTGSRVSDLAYPGSDFDFAFVVKRASQLDAVHARAVEVFTDGKTFTEEFKGATVGFKGNLQFKTKTGLWWLPVTGLKLHHADADKKEKQIVTKGDGTFRALNQHKAIQEHMANRVKVMSVAQQLAYIQMVEFCAGKREEHRLAGQDESVAAWETFYMLAKTEGLALKDLTVPPPTL